MNMYYYHFECPKTIMKWTSSIVLSARHRLQSFASWTSGAHQPTRLAFVSTLDFTKTPNIDESSDDAEDVRVRIL